MKGQSWLRRAAVAAGDFGNDPTAFDPRRVAAAVERVGAFIGPGRYFELDASGFEHIPEGPVLLVGNHSGGTTALDGWGLFRAWYGHFGMSRPLYGLAHEAVFATPWTGSWFAASGILRASPEAARRILVDARGALVVMPGGDADVWRPAREAYRVRFEGRTGYARTALRLGVPIVPVAHVGAHHTLLVLSSGRRFARAVGIHRIARAEVFPVHVSLPWGLTVGPWPHLPIPTRLQYRFGAPILPEAPAADDGEPTPDQVAALDAAVRESLEGMMQDLGRQRQPWTEELRRAATTVVVPGARQAAARLVDRVRRGVLDR